MTLRVGLIGAGAMGGLHARIVATSGASELAWIADPSNSAQATADQWGSRWIPEPDLDSVDAVVIAAPTQYHHALGAAVIDAGKPLLIEKPLADSLAHVDDLIDRSRERDVPLMCGFLERFNPAVRTAVEIAEQPRHLMAARHSPYVERIRTGVASDLLIHDVDLACRLYGGQAESVAAHSGFHHPASDPGSEDTIDATVGFVDGKVASFSASRLSQRKLRTVAIAEVDRLIEVDLLRQDITIFRHIDAGAAINGGPQGYRQQSIMEIPVLLYRGEPLALQWERFLGLVAGEINHEEERAGLREPHRVVFAARDEACALQLDPS